MIITTVVLIMVILVLAILLATLVFKHREIRIKLGDSDKLILERYKIKRLDIDLEDKRLRLAENARHMDLQAKKIESHIVNVSCIPSNVSAL